MSTLFGIIFQSFEKVFSLIISADTLYKDCVQKLIQTTAQENGVGGVILSESIKNLHSFLAPVCQNVIFLYNLRLETAESLIQEK